MKGNGKKKILIVAIVILCVLAVFSFTMVSSAEEVTVVGTWDISKDDGTSKVTAMLYSNGRFVISGTGEMKDYSDSNNSPYYNYKESIKTIEIQNGVTSIGGSTFYFCYSLTNIEIPNSITSIGDKAFFYCEGLTKIEIPSSVTRIGKGTFAGCTSLRSINVDKNNQKYTSEEGILFDREKTELIQYPAGRKEKEYKHPSGVISIGDYAFATCKSLTNIEIPSSVTSIGDSAFHMCRSLTSIEIPSSVTSIGVSAFYECTSLTKIEIPSSVTRIGDWAVAHCKSLRSIKIPSSVTSIEAYAFEECTSLTSIEIPSSVTSIGDRAFHMCKSLRSIEIPSSVTSIGDGAFSSCYSLTSIEIPSDVTSIGNYTFSFCRSLTSIEIPSSVTSIGENAFYDCESLTSIEIPSSVTSIGVYAFYECTSLTKIEIPSSVTRIGDWAFWDCTSLTDINIKNLESNIEFNTKWNNNGNAYVHYSDCIHNISKEIQEFIIEEIDENATQDGKINCRNTYKFRVLDNQGEVVKNKYVKIVSQGNFTNSQNKEYWILSDENGIYTIENVNRNITIKDISDIKNGMTFRVKDQNGIIWNYTYQDGEAINVYYEEGILAEQVEIPSTLGGYNVTSIGNPEIYGNIFKKFSGVENTNVKSIIIPNTVKRIENYAFYKCTKLQDIKFSYQLESIGNMAFGECDNLTKINIPSSVNTIGSLALDCDKLTDIYIDNLKDNINLQARWCPAITYVHYNDCKHSITKQIYTKDKIEIQTVDTEVINGQVNCKTNYQFKLVDKSGNIVTDEEVIVRREGELKNSKKIEERIIPNEKGVYTIENIERDCNIIVVKEYQATDGQGITWNYTYQDGKATNVYYESGDLPEELIIPSTLDGYPVIKLYNSSEEASIFANIIKDDEIYINTKRSLLEYPLFHGKFNVPIKSIIIPDTVTEIGAHAFEICFELTEIEIPDSVTKMGEYSFFGCKKLTNVNLPEKITTIEDYTFTGCASLSRIEIPSSVTSIGENTFYGAKLIMLATIGNENVQEIELPDIIKRTMNEGDILYTSSDFKLTNCSLSEDKMELLIDAEVASKETVSLKVTGGALDGLEVVVVGLKKYEVTEKNGERYIENINPGTKIQEFIDNIETNGTIKFYKGNSEITDVNSKVQTGMIMKITLGEQETSCKLVVKGDLNGDGEMGDIDLLKLVRYQAGLDTSLNGAYLKATDVYKDEICADNKDLLKMARVLAGLDSL